ncbi:hypothetical protein MKY20_24385 [Cytobacillus sp. FSL W8-0315]|uniref:hypothetical protein n=1 Tax=Cytobacillus sp. FSL W8-0315 TaxID=2921600 RepID=UPI0001F45598|nr:hypothetical protein HMPREF1013_05071 [Bacillus sp. 2_A_57_CT2]
MHWVIELRDFYIDFDSQMDKLYKKKQPGSLVSSRKNKIKSLRRKFFEFINVYKESVTALKEPNLIATIVLNIGHFLCKDRLVEDLYKEDYSELAIEGFDDLVSYYADFLTIEMRLNRSESDKLAPKVVRVLHYLLEKSKGKPIELIDKFNSIKEEASVFNFSNVNSELSLEVREKREWFELVSSIILLTSLNSLNQCSGKHPTFS